LRAVPFRELAPVRAEEVRSVRVDREVGSKRGQDVDLGRGVRDVVVAADDVGDLV
jgi:hypothetical protein